MPSRARQVPRATALRGSSATWKGIFTLSEKRLAMPRRRDPLEDLDDLTLDLRDGLVYAGADLLVADRGLGRMGSDHIPGHDHIVLISTEPTAHLISSPVVRPMLMLCCWAR